jgi:predicted nucleic acid-binding protein
MPKEHLKLMLELLKKEFDEKAELRLAIKMCEVKFQIEKVTPKKTSEDWGEIAFSMKQAGVNDTLAKIKFKLENNEKHTAKMA